MFSDEEEDYDDKLSLSLSMTPLGSTCHESPLAPCSLPSHSPLARHTPDSGHSPHPHTGAVKMENNNSLLDAGGLLTKIKTEDTAGDFTDYDKDVGDSLHHGDSDKLEQENRSPDEPGE